jgi:hypothetical protein
MMDRVVDIIQRHCGEFGLGKGMQHKGKLTQETFHYLKKKPRIMNHCVVQLIICRRLRTVRSQVASVRNIFGVQKDSKSGLWDSSRSQCIRLGRLAISRAFLIPHSPPSLPLNFRMQPILVVTESKSSENSSGGKDVEDTMCLI